MRRTGAGRDGFSLIEALVSLTIAAVTLLAVFELQQQLTAGQRRVEATRARIAAERNALTLLTTVNPMAEPEGERALGGGMTLSWTSVLRGPVRANAGVVFGDGLFEMGLYRIDATLSGPTLRDPQPITIARVGWRSLRTAEAGDAF